jgi:hypothetical protein
LPAESLFCHLSQLLSDPAVLLCELAVASRVFPVFVPTIPVFGCFLVCLCGPLLTPCGSFQAVSRRSLSFPRFLAHSLGSLTGAECLFGGPQTRIKFGLVAGFYLGH